MVKITIMVGLPGSGKTSYIKNHPELYKDSFICDDYHEGSESFEGSAYYSGLCNALRDKKDIIISDIIYCKKEKLDFIIDKIKFLIRNLGIDMHLEIVYFENNPEACRKNILNRKREGMVKKELEFIENVSPDYHIPSEAKIVPILGSK